MTCLQAGHTRAFSSMGHNTGNETVRVPFQGLFQHREIARREMRHRPPITACFVSQRPHEFSNARRNVRFHAELDETGSPLERS